MMKKKSDAIASGERPGRAETPMRCKAGGAKVGSTIDRAIPRMPPSIRVEVGLGARRGAVVAYDDTRLVHGRPFRSFIEFRLRPGRGEPRLRIARHGRQTRSALASRRTYGGERQTEDSLRQMMAGARKALDEAGCSLVGGHTCEGSELALGFSINGAVDEVLAKGNLQKGDALILTKPLGTGVVFAGDMRALADASDVAEALQGMCRSNAHAAATLRQFGCLACTDVTGFGLIGHLAELCRGSNGARVRVDLNDVPMLPGALRLASMGVVSSLHPENLRARRVRTTRRHRSWSDYELLYDPQTRAGLAAVPADRAAACVAALRRRLPACGRRRVPSARSVRAPARSRRPGDGPLARDPTR